MPQKLTDEEFRAKAREKHGDKYEYLDPYINSSTPIRVLCKKHNYVFRPKPMNHIYGRATRCPICASESRKNKLRIPPSEIIALARQVHGVDRYDYSQVGDFANIGDIVNIVCHKKDADGNEHGIFPQTFRDHIYSHQGCPKCKAENRKKLIFGVGVNDTTISTDSDCYVKWYQMLNRCYGYKSEIYHPTYTDCIVLDEWHYLSNFVKWFNDPANGYRDGYALDKDILVKGNKVYGSDTCCFVPQEINSLFTKNNAKRGIYPIGVQKRCNKFTASLFIKGKGKRIHLGYFSTPEEAFYAYKEAKEAHIKEIATAYYNEGKITKRVYDALMHYEVEITD